MPRNTLVRLRRGTSLEWSSVNPLLASGEPGYEVDTNKLKIGNGISNWNSLGYIGAGGGGGGSPTVVYSPTTSIIITENSGEVIVLANATSGSLTVNLPTAIANTAKITVKKTDSSVNTVVIDANSTQTIDGSLTKTIEFQYTSVTLISNGSNWFII